MDLDPARYARAVAATANPADLAVFPDLDVLIRGLLRHGISQEHQDWWARTGQVRVVGNIVDSTQCGGADAVEAAVAVMYAWIVLGRPVDDKHEVDMYEWARAAVVWQAGRDLKPVYKDFLEEIGGETNDGESR